MNKLSLKKALYFLAKFTGLFLLSSFLYRKKLLILCYHGFELDDESSFRPMLYIRPETFADRIQLLEKKGLNIVKLATALEQLEHNNLPPKSIVITIDDGFYSVLSRAAPILKAHDLPATLYLTSYYFNKMTPIFGLAVQYLFWKTNKDSVNLAGLNIDRVDNNSRELITEELQQRVIDYGYGLDSEDERTKLLKKLAKRLDLDTEEIESSRKFTLVNQEELGQLQRAGIDIQLHTHRHHFPNDPHLASQEILENKRIVEPFLDYPMSHFCYPSGEWSVAHWPVLESLGISSATTCEPGLVDASSKSYALPRFLDGENISSIEFEAEIAGFAELIRSARSRLLRKT